MYLSVIIWILSSVFIVSHADSICPRYAQFRQASSHFSNKISGGIVADIGDVPYQVEVVGYQKYCGGIIIHSRWVLTAAHCFRFLGWAGNVFVYYRSTDRNDPYRRMFCRGVISIIGHENYRKFFNDVSLLKVDEDIQLSRELQVLPALIREYDISNVEDRAAVVSGWGRISTEHHSEYLHYLEVKIMKKKQCEEWLGQLGKTDAVLCAQGNAITETGCVGDSGGPLVLKGTMDLIGVLSYAAVYECGRNYPMTFMNVTYYRSWIINKIAPDILP